MLAITPFFLSLSSLSQTLVVTLFFFFFSEGWFRVNFDPKITPPNCFSFYPNWISDFTYFLFSFVCVCDFVVFERLCLFWFPLFVRCVFDFPSLCGVYLIQVERLALSKGKSDQWQVFRRHEYSHICHICRHRYLLFYAINMDVVSLFIDSSFLFLANLDLYCIDVLYQFEWMDIDYFCQKKRLLLQFHQFGINVL